jgi:hypothetical protein
VIRDVKFAPLIAFSHKKSVHQFVSEKIAFERWTREALWGGELAMDAVLAPVYALPALPHDRCDRLSPVGVIYVTRVDPKRDGLSDEWHKAPVDGSRLLEEEIYKPRGAYNPSAMEGLPRGCPWACRLSVDHGKKKRWSPSCTLLMIPSGHADLAPGLGLRISRWEAQMSAKDDWFTSYI